VEAHVVGVRLQVAQEKSELREVRGSNSAETQWRQLVKNMEAWNRIVMNLVRLARSCRCSSHKALTSCACTGAQHAQGGLDGSSFSVRPRRVQQDGRRSGDRQRV
jgi:hypothetical protein